MVIGEVAVLPIVSTQTSSTESQMVVVVEFKRKMEKDKTQDEAVV
jgi:hypothetical protein